jgi:FAD:protein FMN transferase
MIAAGDATAGASMRSRRFGSRPGGRRSAPVAVQVSPIVPFSLSARSMGGRLVIHLDPDGRSGSRPGTESRDAQMTIDRIERWASRLTRFTDVSDLSRLNADTSGEVRVRPTLAAALRGGAYASQETGGLVDIALLDERLAAEGLVKPGPSAALDTGDRGEWSITLEGRGAAVIRRPAGLRFDLGGVGKGWIADRALRLLSAWPSAVIDADGDLAVRCAPGKTWEMAIEDPRDPDKMLAVLHLSAAAGDAPTQWGVATSGTTIHRWTVDGTARHHLIDPRTGASAHTDVVQATVIAETALRAESLAKAAIIAGTVAGFALLDRARVRGAVLLTERGETLALPRTTELLRAE